MMKNGKTTFKVAMAGVSAALVTIFLIGAHYSPIGKLSFYVMAGLSLLLPILSGSLWACAMAYLAGGALSMIFSVVGVLPFALIFGLQTVLFGLCLKYEIKPIVYLPVKAVLFAGALYVVVKVYGFGFVESVFSRLGIPTEFWCVALILTPFYVAYDFSYKYIYGWLARRMKRVIDKYAPLKTKPNKPDAPRSEDSDIFGLDDKDDRSNKDSSE